MDLEPLDRLEEMVRKAKRAPLSASVVIHKDEVLALLQALRASLPREADEAKQVVSDRDRLLDDARTGAEHILEQARSERARLLARTEVVKAAESEAERIRREADAAAAKLRVEADDWVDAKLANLEILLEKTLKSVHRGRERLRRTLEAAQDIVTPLNLDDSGEISGEIVLEHEQPGPYVSP